MNKEKMIIVTHALRKKIIEVMDVSYPTVRAALFFKTNTIKARLIRKYAIEHGADLIELSETNDIYEK